MTMCSDEFRLSNFGGSSHIISATSLFHLKLTDGYSKNRRLFGYMSATHEGEGP